jgi:hypothetical protein
MQNNSDGYIFKIKKAGKIARFQAWDVETDTYHQIDFESRYAVGQGLRFQLYAVIDKAQTIELREADKNDVVILKVSFNTDYTNLVFVECCVKIEKGAFCVQKEVNFHHAYWRIAKVKKNLKIPI